MNDLLEDYARTISSLYWDFQHEELLYKETVCERERQIELDKWVERLVNKLELINKNYPKRSIFSAFDPFQSNSGYHSYYGYTRCLDRLLLTFELKGLMTNMYVIRWSEESIYHNKMKAYFYRAFKKALKEKGLWNWLQSLKSHYMTKRYVVFDTKTNLYLDIDRPDRVSSARLLALRDIKNLFFNYSKKFNSWIIMKIPKDTLKKAYF